MQRAIGYVQDVPDREIKPGRYLPAERRQPVLSAVPSSNRPSADPVTEALFTDLYVRYHPAVYRIVLRIVGNPEEADDLTQDVFIKAYCHFNSPPLGGPYNVGGWLYRIAINTSIDALRRRKRIQYLPIDTVYETFPANEEVDSEPEQAALLHEQHTALNDLLMKLKPRLRTCLILHELQSFQCREIAEMMGTTPSNVRIMLFRAREQFRYYYSQDRIHLDDHEEAA